MPAKIKRRLTLKQVAFVQEYLVDFNATQAVIRAGYSPRSAKQIGHELLDNTLLRQALQVALEKRRKKTEIDAQYIREGLKDNFERAMQHKPAVDEQGQPVGEYRYEGSVANRSLELLGRHVPGFFQAEPQPVSPFTMNVLVTSPDWIQLRNRLIRVLEGYP